MLTRQEKNDLVTIVDILFNDNQLRSLKYSFSERTVDVIEQAMEELVKCNASMKEPVMGLVSGASVIGRSWLRQSLDKIAQALRDKQLQFDGMACRNQVAANFRQEIYLSTF